MKSPVKLNSKFPSKQFGGHTWSDDSSDSSFSNNPLSIPGTAHNLISTDTSAEWFDDEFTNKKTSAKITRELSIQTSDPECKLKQKTKLMKSTAINTNTTEKNVAFAQTNITLCVCQLKNLERLDSGDESGPSGRFRTQTNESCKKHFGAKIQDKESPHSTNNQEPHSQEITIKFCEGTKVYPNLNSRDGGGDVKKTHLLNVEKPSEGVKNYVENRMIKHHRNGCHDLSEKESSSDTEWDEVVRKKNGVPVKVLCVEHKTESNEQETLDSVESYEKKSKQNMNHKQGVKLKRDGKRKREVKLKKGMKLKKAVKSKPELTSKDEKVLEIKLKTEMKPESTTKKELNPEWTPEKEMKPKSTLEKEIKQESTSAQVIQPELTIGKEIKTELTTENEVKLELTRKNELKLGTEETKEGLTDKNERRERNDLLPRCGKSPRAENLDFLISELKLRCDHCRGYKDTYTYVQKKVGSKRDNCLQHWDQLMKGLYPKVVESPNSQKLIPLVNGVRQ